jgi:hypothetical protein
MQVLQDLGQFYLKWKKKYLKRLGPSSQYNKIELKKGSNLIGRLNTGTGFY